MRNVELAEGSESRFLPDAEGVLEVGGRVGLSIPGGADVGCDLRPVLSPGAQDPFRPVRVPVVELNAEDLAEA